MTSTFLCEIDVTLLFPAITFLLIPDPDAESKQDQLGDDHEDRLEEQRLAEAFGVPIEYSEDVGDQENGTHVDREVAQRVCILNQLILRNVANKRPEGHD